MSEPLREIGVNLAGVFALGGVFVALGMAYQLGRTRHDTAMRDLSDREIKFMIENLREELKRRNKMGEL